MRRSPDLRQEIERSNFRKQGNGIEQRAVPQRTEDQHQGHDAVPPEAVLKGGSE